MNDIRDFLSWFEGFQENIKHRPTAAQWAKVVERIRKIQVPPAPAVHSVVQAAQAKSVDPLVQKPRPEMSRGAAMSAGP